MRIVSLLLFVAATCLARHHRLNTHRRSHTVHRDGVELIPVQEEKGNKDNTDENDKTDDIDGDQYDAGRDWYDEEFFREYLAEMDELELYDDKEIDKEYPVEKDKSEYYNDVDIESIMKKIMLSKHPVEKDEWFDDEETDYDEKEDDNYNEDIDKDYAFKDILEWYDEENDSEYPAEEDESEWFDDVDNYVEKESESYGEISENNYPFVKDESEQYDDEKVDGNYHVEKEKLYDDFKDKNIHEDNTKTSLDKIDDDLTATAAFFAVKAGETRHHSSSSIMSVNVFSSLACLFVTFYM